VSLTPLATPLRIFLVSVASVPPRCIMMTQTNAQMCDSTNPLHHHPSLIRRKPGYRLIIQQVLARVYELKAPPHRNMGLDRHHRDNRGADSFPWRRSFPWRHSFPWRRGNCGAPHNLDPSSTTEARAGILTTVIGRLPVGVGECALLGLRMAGAPAQQGLDTL
jgi:hypothetical protein